MAEPEEVIRQFRAGELTAEAAAEQLLPSLKAAGKLELELSETDMPVLAALQLLTRPKLPAAQPLTWESKSWLALEGLPDSFWRQIREHGLDQVPQCLNYVFTVSSAVAAEVLTQRIESTSDHVVMTDLPPSFEEFNGRLFGRTAPRLLTRADLVEWAAWLRAIPPIADASLERLHLSGPPATARQES